MELMLLKLREISISVVPILLAVILHEVSHGWVADRLGDSTARYSGRLTLNPAAHIDLFLREEGSYSATPNPFPLTRTT
jgi:Zn-dependent protease